MQDEVKVTREYQVTIPKSVRTELGIKNGDKLIVRAENKRILIESPKHIANPSDALWCLFGKPIDVEAADLVEDSWKHTVPVEFKKPHSGRDFCCCWQ